MGLFSWFTRKPAPRFDEPHNIAFEESFWKDVFSYAVSSNAGEAVNWKTVKTNPTALRCGLVIADGVSTVPCKLMRKNRETGKREEATDHPLYWLFKRKPSPVQNSLEFRETMAIHAVFAGNAYVFKNRVRGQIRELIVIPPNAVRVQQEEDYSLTYEVTGLDGSTRKLTSEEIWHFRGPSWDGFRGFDMTKQLRNAIGLAMASERAHSGRFKNGIQTTGTYSVDGTLNADQHKRLSEWIKQNFAGARNSGTPMLLDRGAKWNPMEMTGVDAEHVATRMLQIEEICTGFGVKPIMVGHADKSSTYASAEQMFLAHAVHTIRPWHRRFEASMNAELLTDAEARAGYYFKFVDTELLRGAAKDRAEYYTKLFAVGAASPNEIAEFEDMESTQDGDMRFRPANMTPITAETNKPEPAPAPAAPGAAPQQQRMNIGRILSTENEGLIRDARDNLDTVLDKMSNDPPDGDADDTGAGLPQE